MERGHGPGARTVVVGALGDSVSPVDSFLMAMRLGCRGVRAVNLGTGVTLDRAAAELECRDEAEALLLLCGDDPATVARQLSGLGELVATGGVTRPVLVGGTGAGSWRELLTIAGGLRRAGVTQVLADLADAAHLLPVYGRPVRDLPLPAHESPPVPRVA
ncbi:MULTISPECIES: hypothetical protein [unclassified Streptomyces]|uniref:hypothetical protein n=1 Tax=unclassified Streptomyces TaxID=2593676 RepID=UPI00136DEB3C|nr:MULTISPECIES: hypothetical protein [unclassified Streptomyces]MCW5249592.1 hypothetical protein [Streptomyces sp. SHP 1-2]MYU24686.1 hypothetical protein [Streptomyces sp. SID8352]